MGNELMKRFLSSIILIPIIIFLIIEGSLLFNFFISICFLISLYEWNKLCKNNFLIITGFFYLIISFYTIYELINFNGSNVYFFFVIIICISTDIGGYTFGKIFKGPKLTNLSPNKTFSGLIGSYIFAVFSSILFLNSSLILMNQIDINIFVFMFIFLVSSISQLGDILISYFKRQSKIKDTGKIIPGHGGLLDRIDGMIFAFPYSFLLMKFII